MMPWNLIVTLVCLTLSTMALPARQPSEADLQKLKSDIRAVQERIRSGLGQETLLQKNLRETETMLGRIERDVQVLKNTITDQQKQLTALNQEASALEARKKSNEEQIIAQINTSYRMGRENRIKILLNQEDPQRLSRSLAYSDYFNRAYVDSIQQYQITLAKIEQNRQAIAQKNRELLASRDAMVVQQKALHSAYQTRSADLAKLKHSIKTDQQSLQQLEQERKQLEALLRSVQASIASIKLPGDAVPFKNAKGNLRWPTRGKRDDRFGTMRSPGNLLWQGIAFYADPGREVYAVHHGRVIFADWFRGKGLLMIIDHGDGYMTLYAHNQSLLRETGDWVSAGDRIAAVGNSGGLDHYELYFEIRHLGEPLNPKFWLKQKG